MVKRDGDLFVFFMHNQTVPHNIHDSLLLFACNIELCYPNKVPGGTFNPNFHLLYADWAVCMFQMEIGWVYQPDDESINIYSLRQKRSQLPIF